MSDNYIGVCESCKKQDTITHLHHIVPRSKGGSDENSNLIRLCLSCHGKVHDVTFKGDDGVVKNGIKNSKLLNKEARKWCDNNQDLIELFFYNLSNKEPILSEYITCACNLGLVLAEDFYHLFGYTERFSQTGLKLTKVLKAKILCVWQETLNDSI